MTEISDKASGRTRAQNHFAAAERRDTLVKQMIAAENAARDAKTARLRSLRLAKEEAERLAGSRDTAKPAAQPVRKRHRRVNVK
ncbi:MAG TPA: hypothetical protein VG819_02425 [Rhizomicrobium sp.]|jgi:hypothetical protein|nr:hypothetical protein [Rhizomicrobium sp.]